MPLNRMWYGEMMKSASYRIIATVFFYFLTIVPVAQAGLQDNGDNTVTDSATGLTWHTDSFGPYSWQEALAACTNYGKLAGV